ncbi:hypothetical protein RND81_12G184300 [Saponaria officinalis]|uniref:Uncharacterized protein n=1 Tax=Saponaria officinalis TaxID=3572 RepID=A0AAW1HCE7_SAPOF
MREASFWLECHYKGASFDYAIHDVDFIQLLDVIADFEVVSMKQQVLLPNVYDLFYKTRRGLRRQTKHDGDLLGMLMEYQGLETIEVWIEDTNNPIKEFKLVEQLKKAAKEEQERKEKEERERKRMEDEMVFVQPLAVEILVVDVDTEETVFVRVYQSEDYVEDSNFNPNPDATNEATVEKQNSKPNPNRNPNSNPNPNPEPTKEPTFEDSNSNANPERDSTTEPVHEEPNTPSNANPNCHNSTTKPVHEEPNISSNAKPNEEPNTNSNPNSTTEPTPIPTQLSQNCPTSNRFTTEGFTYNNSEGATNLSHLSTKKPPTKQKIPKTTAKRKGIDISTQLPSKQRRSEGDSSKVKLGRGYRSAERITRFVDEMEGEGSDECDSEADSEADTEDSEGSEMDEDYDGNGEDGEDSEDVSVELERSEGGKNVDDDENPNQMHPFDKVIIPNEGEGEHHLENTFKNGKMYVPQRWGGDYIEALVDIYVEDRVPLCFI